MKRLLTLLALAVAILTSLTGPATAAPVTFTEVRKDVAESFREVDPCVGPSTFNIVFNDVFHVTEFVAGPNEGTIHVTYTQTGTFVVETDDPALGDFTGRFTIWDGFNLNRRSVTHTFTFNATGWSDDGLRVRFHALEHVTVTATGVENSFSMESTDCPV